MMTIAGSVQEKKSLRMPQDRFSRGGWLLRYPPFRGASSTPSIMRLTFFANAKTMWTLPLLWTQRTRPQEFGNLAKNARFPQRPHRSSFSLKAKKEEQNHSDQLSTKSDHPHPAVAKPRKLRIEAERPDGRMAIHQQTPQSRLPGAQIDRLREKAHELRIDLVGVRPQHAVRPAGQFHEFDVLDQLRLPP